MPKLERIRLFMAINIIAVNAVAKTKEANIIIKICISHNEIRNDSVDPIAISIPLFASRPFINLSINNADINTMPKINAEPTYKKIWEIIFSTF